MSLDQLIAVSIVVSATAPSAANFGVPLIAAYHTHNVQPIRYYTSLSGMVSDGFSITEPAYLAASEVMQQNPTVTTFAIGRRTLAFSQVIKLLLSSTSNKDIYSFQITGSDGVKHTVTMPSTGVPATDATSLAGYFPTSPVTKSGTGTLALTLTGTPLIQGALSVQITTAGVEGTAAFSWQMGAQSGTAVTTGVTNVLGTTGLTANWGVGTAVKGDSYSATVVLNVGTVSVDSSTSVKFAQTAGAMNNFASWAGNGQPGGGGAGTPILALTDATTDPGIATDLANIYAADQGFYGISLDSNSAAEIEAAAAWVEANGAHVLSVNCSDASCIGSGTSVFTVLQTHGYTRTHCQFNGSELLSYGGAALLGVILPQTPGTYTPAYKTQVGVPVDPASILTGSAVNALTTANGNYYTKFKGVSVLIPGVTPSGEFLDTVIFIDWLKDAIQTAAFTLLTNNLKIAYTDLGVATIVNVIKGVLGQGVQQQGLAASPAPTVSAPTVASISQANVAKRNLPNVTFAATLAGAIQGLQISGSVVLP